MHLPMFATRKLGPTESRPEWVLTRPEWLLTRSNVGCKRESKVKASWATSDTQRRHERSEAPDRRGSKLGMGTPLQRLGHAPRRRHGRPGHALRGAGEPRAPRGRPVIERLLDLGRQIICIDVLPLQFSPCRVLPPNVGCYQLEAVLIGVLLMLFYRRSAALWPVVLGHYLTDMSNSGYDGSLKCLIRKTTRKAPSGVRTSSEADCKHSAIMF